MNCNRALTHNTPTKDLRGNPKPRVSPDRTETSPGSWNIFKNIFGSGQVRLGNFISGRSGLGNFILGRSRSGYFLPGYAPLFLKYCGIGHLKN